MGKLDGKVALITGGASGIGRGVANLYAKEGAAVGLFDLNGENAKAVAKEVSAHGGKVAVAIGDVSKESDVEKGLQSLVAELGDVDIMVKANLDHTDIMKQFANPPTGYGIDIHFKKITALGNRIPEKEFTTELLGESYKAAVAMHMLKTYKFPENPKVFAKLVDAALEPSARWAEAVGKKDGAGGSRMVYETTLACGACHKTYR